MESNYQCIIKFQFSLGLWHFVTPICVQNNLFWCIVKFSSENLKKQYDKKKLWFFFKKKSLRYFVFQMVLKFLSFLVHHINPLPHIAMFFFMSSLVVNEWHSRWVALVLYSNNCEFVLVQGHIVMVVWPIIKGGSWDWTHWSGTWCFW